MNKEKRRERAKRKAKETRIERSRPLKHLKRFMDGGYVLTEKGRRLIKL